MIDRQEDGSGTYAYRRPHELPSVSSCAQRRDLGGVLSFAHTTTLQIPCQFAPFCLCSTTPPTNEGIPCAT
jgi:hypothetical protein